MRQHSPYGSILVFRNGLSSGASLATSLGPPICSHELIRNPISRNDAPRSLTNDP
jgi:hypothetical protein